MHEWIDVLSYPSVPGITNSCMYEGTNPVHISLYIYVHVQRGIEQLLSVNRSWDMISEEALCVLDPTGKETEQGHLHFPPYVLQLSLPNIYRSTSKLLIKNIGFLDIRP